MTDRPTGTVTFLFTDIEGSTGRWEEQTAEMRVALARHDEVLRGAVGARGGWLFKHTGDGILAAFSSPLAAVNAAIAAQRALELPVRMGLATGEVELRDGDYFGPTLNRAARVMSAGHGGQVLVANSTAALLDGVDLLDLGEHRLRDLSRPQRLYQVRAEGLRESFPPLRTLDATPGNLPLQPTSLIGRDEQVAQVVDQLKRHRLVTLTGVGGVGKTRLALQGAAELAAEYPGGAWIVGLASVADPGAVAYAMAATLGITPQPEKTIEQSVVAALSGRHMLLLLDNCEHLIDTVADLADRVVRHCAGVTLLATSREALRVDGEQTWNVPSLDTRSGLFSPAVELFSERARAVLPSFEPAADADSVEEICRRLDGIPLAIELAAARVRSMSPAQIRDRLDERFRLLTGGARRSLERHQTLRHAVQWSYDLLEENERVLLRRTSVFAGGFSLEAAEQVCCGDGLDEVEVVDLLDSLVRKSLLTTDRLGAEVRYGLLETIRQFAEEQLGLAGEAADVRTRHSRYFADAAARNWELWLSPRQRLANEWFERELPNLRTAFRWAMETGDIETGARIPIETEFIGYGLLIFEPTLWAIEALPAARAAGVRELPDLLSAAAASVVLGRLAEAEAAAREAINLAENGQGAIRSTLPWFWLALSLGNVRAAYLPEAIDLLRSGSNRAEDAPLFLCRGLLAVFLGLSGDLSSALPLAEAAVAEAAEYGVPGGLSFSLQVRADIDMYQRHFDEAARGLEAAVAVAEGAGLVGQQILCLRDLAIALARAGHLRAALPLFLRQLVSGRESGEWLVTRYTFLQLLPILLAVHHRDAAARLVGIIDESALAPVDLEFYAPALAQVRASLGDVEFERLRREGAAMPFVDLIRYAEAEIQAAIDELEATAKPTGQARPGGGLVGGRAGGPCEERSELV